MTATETDSPAARFRLVVVSPSLDDLAACATALRIAAEGGATAFWVRERGVPEARLRAWIEDRVRELGSREGRRPALILSRSYPLARDLGLEAVQLGHRDPSPQEVRRRRGALLRPWIGFSAHDPLDEASVAAADYVVLGPVFPTPKRGPSPPPLGLERFAAIAARVGRPVVAVGGIDAGNAEAVLAAGADGLCVRRAVLAARDPHAVLAQLREAVVRSFGPAS